jgi:integrase
MKQKGGAVSSGHTRGRSVNASRWRRPGTAAVVLPSGRSACAGSPRAWLLALVSAGDEAEYRFPLGRRPYDLRHAAPSLWLNSGVPTTEVARRAGHGVAVLLKIYAHCIDG